MTDQNQPQQPPQWAPPEQAPAPPPEQAPAPPPAQAGWTPPPPGPATGWGQPMMAAGPPRPIGVTMTAVFYIIAGVFGILGAVAALAFGSVFAGLEGTGGMEWLSGAATVIGAFVLVIAILFLASAVGLLLGKGWARIIGLILGVLGFIVYALATLGSLGSTNTEAGPSGLVVAVVLAILFGLAVWSLVKAGPYFAFRR